MAKIKTVFKTVHQLPKKFNSEGYLNPKDYFVTFAEIRESLLVKGPIGIDPVKWDEKWRLKLVNNFELLTKELWSQGIEDVFMDGSFVTDKPHPNDIDGYFDTKLKVEDAVKFAQLRQKLNMKSTHQLWTWDGRSRRPDKDSMKPQLPMWHRFRVEIYPHVKGQLSGICTQTGKELQFPAAFRKTRGDDRPRGIVKIKKERSND